MITLKCKSSSFTRANLTLTTIVLTTDDIADIIIELSEREIYNDIRCVTANTAGFEEAYSTKTVEQDHCVYSPRVDPGETQTVTVYPESGDTEITWLGIVRYRGTGATLTGITQSACTALGGKWKNVLGGMCMFGDMTEYLSVVPTQQSGNSFTFEITNNHEELTIRYSVEVSYRYLKLRQIALRAVDENSIAKYGRRVMNLTWHLGQGIATMQQIVNGYALKYAEPVPILTVTIQGKTHRLADFILNAKIDDLIRIIHPGLGINHDYWITQLTPSHRTDGMLEVDLTLEQIRLQEETIFWTWDISIWDGTHVWAM